jgi:glutamyl-tRNA reductase
MIQKITNPVIDDVQTELASAYENWPAFNTAHEGWALIQEEMDELWDEVKKKPSKRSKEALYTEAKQVAAMAIRFMIDIACSEGSNHAGTP